MTSIDGINWVTGNAINSNQWESICYGNGLFVAVSDSGSSRIMTSGKQQQVLQVQEMNLQSVMTLGNNAGSLPIIAPGGITGATGSFSTCSATTFQTTSDYRIKENVLNLDDTYIIDSLRPVAYINSQLKKQDIGFIAHEVQEVFPQLVHGEKDGIQMQSLNYSGLLPILVKEIQELKNKNKQIQEKLNTLEKKLEIRN
jgi:hypothetical protein